MNTAKKAALALAAAGVALGASVVPAVAYDGDDFAGSQASGVTQGSPGVVSGNVIQVPIDIPINICGNTIDIIALLNPTFGNTCVNNSPRREVHHEEIHHESVRHHEGRHHDSGHHEDGHHDGGHDDGRH
ncbi:chaplin [Streptomyces sp. NPDC026206]|uniref:chaplin n=1 Tax=Streptomyces sp. NPDC026206 TaxID=3157089 RepID=UPI0033ECDF67